MTTEIPKWYTLIQTAKHRGDIVTGLTIPYLIGALNINNSDFTATKEDVHELLTDIASSITELNPVLKECDLIHEYVVALSSPEFCGDNFKSQLSFQSESGIKTLYVINEAKILGNNLIEISQNLYNKYVDCSFSKKRYSWDYKKTDWFPFTEREKGTIAVALD